MSLINKTLVHVKNVGFKQDLIFLLEDYKVSDFLYECTNLNTTSNYLLKNSISHFYSNSKEYFDKFAEWSFISSKRLILE